MRLLRFVAAMTVLIATATGPRAQERQAPTFHSQIVAVSIDVSVLDNHRHPVIGLPADDFTILVAGHVHPAIAFAAVDALASKGRLRQFPPSLSVANADPLGPSAGAGSPGRIVAIIVSPPHRDLSV